MKLFLKKESGSVMLEYIVITTVFMLGIGTALYIGAGNFDRFSGVFPQAFRDSMAEGTVDESDFSTRFTEASNLKKYGAAGGAFASQTQMAQKVIALPQI